jgi:hypothetical protein
MTRIQQVYYRMIVCMCGHYKFQHHKHSKRKNSRDVCEICKCRRLKVDHERSRPIVK